MWSKRRLWAAALALVVVTSPWWLGGARNTMRRAMLMTTADPDVLGLVATASMTPMSVALHTKRPETILISGPTGQRWSRTGHTIDERVVFKAPAAYFSVLDLKEGPAGPQRVGISVWSSKFDPARPYLLEAMKEDGYRPTDPNRPNALLRRSHETGEYVLDFELSSYSRSDPAERQRVLTSLSRVEDRPCDRRFDPALQMIVIAVPDGVSPRESCLRTGFGNAAIYVSNNEDGTVKFMAKCGGNGPKGRLLTERCALTGFFGNWPLNVWAPAQHLSTWNTSFEGIQKFLTGITQGNG